MLLRDYAVLIKNPCLKLKFVYKTSNSVLYMLCYQKVAVFLLKHLNCNKAIIVALSSPAAIGKSTRCVGVSLVDCNCSVKFNILMPKLLDSSVLHHAFGRKFVK